MRPHAMIVTLMAAIVAAAPLVGAQSAQTGAEVKEDGDKFVLVNEDITVWFHGKKPFLKVFPTSAGEDNESAAFSYKFHSVVEYRDLNGDDLPSNTEIVSSLSLERASGWMVETSEENGTVVLNLTLEAPVKTAAGVLPDGVEIPTDQTARVSLVFTLSSETVTVDTGDANVTVPTHAVKYDFVVDEWPTAQGSDSRLALEARVTGTLDAADALGLSGAAVADANATQTGFVAWTDNATGVTLDGEEVEVPVVTEIRGAADASDPLSTSAENATTSRLVHTYDVADLASLVHDPFIGVASADGVDANDVAEGVRDAASKVPGAGLLLVAVATAGAALVAGRRKQA